MSYKTICKIALALLCSSSIAYAGVEIGGSRVVYNGNMKQATISINNPDDKPYLIQSWVNKQVDSDDDDETFITTPPFSDLNPIAKTRCVSSTPVSRCRRIKSQSIG